MVSSPKDTEILPTLGPHQSSRPALVLIAAQPAWHHLAHAKNVHHLTIKKAVDLIRIAGFTIQKNTIKPGRFNMM